MAEVSDHGLRGVLRRLCTCKEEVHNLIDHEIISEDLRRLQEQ